jgi:deoxyribodipyrimidine photolyase-related protein
MVSGANGVRNMIVVLGDQLSLDLASLKAGDRARDVVVMGEIVEETLYAGHHKKKLVFVLSAMRHFAEELRGDGWRVDYARLDRDRPYASFNAFFADMALRHAPERIAAVEAGEFRVRTIMEGWEALCGIPVDILADDRFVASTKGFAAWAHGRREMRMEHFYRVMRKKTGLLMEDGEPAGGAWNYDKENRRVLPKRRLIPEPIRFSPDAITREVIDLVGGRFAQNFGAIEPFEFATTRRDAEKARDQFLNERLAEFGDYQDAMTTRSRFLYHAVLSLYLNVGLLDPLDLCRRAERAWREKRAPLNAVEGFIRQIIGWREYVRGVYFLSGPDYVARNALTAKRPLPSFFWTAETDMACVRKVVETTRDEAYAHHIQRLMVTGNFALLTGVDPHEVHLWYLAVYVDAFEWVEAPNTIGMSQYADGGVMASKPYAASGAYINRMSDYCGSCPYDWRDKTGPNACPFNALYWDFLARNEPRLRANMRLKLAYATLAQMAPGERGALRQKAADTLGKLDRGERV